MFKIKNDKLIYVCKNSEEKEIIDIKELNWDDELSIKENIEDNSKITINLYESSIIDEKIQPMSYGYGYYVTFQLILEINNVIIDEFESSEREIAIIRVSDLSQEAKFKLLEQYHFDATVDYEELF